MTSLTQAACAICGLASSSGHEPPRRTLDRGPDPEDDSFSVIVRLPDVPLCDQHARQVREGDLHLGWCDDPGCREYGEAGERSACGAAFVQLGGSRSRSAPKRH
jgi:hypothetical protein